MLRCDYEIELGLSRPDHNFFAAMGHLDWLIEKRMIQEELEEMKQILEIKDNVVAEAFIDHYHVVELVIKDGWLCTKAHFPAYINMGVERDYTLFKRGFDTAIDRLIKHNKMQEDLNGIQSKA